MSSNQMQIIPYSRQYQIEIDILMDKIREEFQEPISSQKSFMAADAIKLPDEYLLALVNNKVVGTISVTKLENSNSVLRRMFLNKNFRGQGIAESLLTQATNWAIQNKLKAIYLGTMTQFKAAQKFYEKHNFKKITLENLPADFPVNPVDSIFYKKDLDSVK
jgi:N-acetylglutamate synthase-like GNAT family acetyltransferase